MKELDLFKRNFKKYFKIYLIAVLLVCILELALILRAIINANRYGGFDWRHLCYFCAYVFLFSLSLAASYALIKYRDMIDDKILLFNRILRIYIYGIIIWSIFVSFIDVVGNGQPIVYLTVLMAIASITVSTPKKFSIMSIASYILLLLSVIIYDSNVKGSIDLNVITNGMFINMSVFVATANFICFKLYKSSIYEQEALARLSELSKIDTLTNLMNRRCLDDAILEKHNLKQSHVFGLIDIDNFKNVNDVYGHKIGDDVLIIVSQIIAKHFKNKMVFRYGGDEFAIIDDHDVEYVFGLLSHAQKEIDKLDLECKPHISFGLCETNGLENPKDVFIKADQALYKAKNSGKNCGFIYK